MYNVYYTQYTIYRYDLYYVCRDFPLLFDVLEQQCEYGCDVKSDLRKSRILDCSQNPGHIENKDGQMQCDFNGDFYLRCICMFICFQIINTSSKTKFYILEKV